MRSTSTLFVAAAVLSFLVTPPVAAQAFPSKPVRLVVPFPAGGTGDVIARMLSAPLTRALGQNLLVDNRPGGGTVIGTELVARSPADGHTMLMVFNTFAINPGVRPKLPFDTVKDFAGVTKLATTPLVFAVHPSLPAKQLRDLVAIARARPGELTYGTPVLGGASHIAGEMFKQMAKIDLVHVPYQGAAPATIAVLGGHTTILLGNVSDVVPHAAVGRLRPLAVGSLERSPVLKDVPTVAESYPGFEATLWVGAVVPKATPRDALLRLNTEFGRALDSADLRSGLDKLGLSGAAGTPEQFEAFLTAEMRRNGETARKANIRIE